MQRIFLLFVFVMVLCTSCTHTIYVPTETVRTDSVKVTTIAVDTLLCRDSIYVERNGDTIRELRWKYIYKSKLSVDTMYVEHVDSIQVPYPVETPLTKWQKTKMEFGGVAMGVVLVALCAAVAWLVLKIRKRLGA